MQTRLKPFAIALALISAISMPVYATVTDTEVQDLNAQAVELKKTLASLQSQVNALENQVKRANKSANTSSQTSSSSKSKVSGSLSGSQLRKLIQEEKEYLPFDMDVPGQAFVSTGPYVGVPFQFAGSDLVVNTPSVDTDVQLLGIRKSIMQQLSAMGGEIVKEPYHSHLLLSGLVEANVGYLDRTGIPGVHSATDIDLSSISLDAFILGPSDWLLGFIEFNYVDLAPANDVFGGTSQYRVADSRVAINKAFVTIGNFTQSPFYGSFGQFYVPFGAYSSVMVSTPLTNMLTRTKARSILVGFQQQEENAFYGAAYIFRGDSRLTSTLNINNGGINLGYKFKTESVHGKVGGGVIANIADSSGMQYSGGFQNNELLVHRVPGYNLRGVLSLGSHLDLIGEYVGASTSFNPNNLSYNGRGAKPWAYDVEAAYSLEIFKDKPSAIGVGYAQSGEALALGLPLNRVSLVMNASLWRNTLQSLEVRRDLEYPSSNTASGAGGVVAASETGNIDKAIVAQFDYYF
jgi:hypothetical protein